MPLILDQNKRPQEVLRQEVTVPPESIRDDVLVMPESLLMLRVALCQLVAVLGGVAQDIGLLETLASVFQHVHDIVPYDCSIGIAV